jgi:opacity protein-like surface antigen
MQKYFVLVMGAVLVLSLAAVAQENRSELSFQGTGLFTTSSSGNGTTYSATESAGGLITYRHHLNHWLSVEGSYGFTADTQKYSLSGSPFRIQSGIHQFTGAMVVNLPTRTHSKINPYFLLGGGGLLFDPTGNQFNSLSGASSQTKAAFLYGIGMNYALSRHVALRAEYRGLLYQNPDFGFGALATNAVTHTAVPSVGVAFRF